MFPPDIAVEDLLLIIATAAIFSLICSSIVRRHWHRTPLYRLAVFKEEKHRGVSQTILIIVITYLVVQALWLMCSAPAVADILHNILLTTSLFPFQGIVATAVITALLGWVISVNLQRSMRTEERLHVSEERFRRIFESSATGIMLVDQKGCFMGLNRAFCQMTGYEENELLGLHFTQITHPDDRDRCLSDIHQLVEGSKDPLHMQKRYICKNHDIIWASVVGTVVRDSQGRPLFLVGQVENITQRRQTEEALRLSEQKFRQLIEKSLVGVYIVQDGKFVYGNPRLSEITGYSQEELLQLPSVLEVVVASDHPKVTEQVRKRMAGEIGSAHYTFNSRRKDGSEFIAEVHGSLTDYNGRPALLGTVLDSTLQKRAEEALRQNEQLLRQIIDLVPHFIFAKDVEGRYILANKAVTKAYATTMDQLIGKTDVELAPSKEEARKFHENDVAVLKNGQRLILEEQITTSEGTIRQLSTVKIPFIFGTTTRAVLGVAVDITDQKNAEAWLHETSAQLLRLQDEEHRRIARELHDTTAQSLAALTMNLSFLQRSDPTQRERIQTVLSESIGLAERCLQEIRTLSYLLHPPELDVVGLRGAIQEYATGFARRSGIDTIVEIGANLQRLTPDAELAIFRVVQEALGNILRHAKSPSAEISLERTDHHITLEVTDTGIGIPADRLAQINNLRGAVGVGFAGMRERLRQLGGTLEIISSVAGTTVRAIVPLKK